MRRNNILVIKLGALGDFIQSLGPMRAIRQHHPDAHITLLTTAPFTAFAQKSSYFDSILTDIRPKYYQPLKWYRLRHMLNKPHFSRVYDLQNNDRTSLYFRLFSPRPEWVGTARGASHRNVSPERTQGQAFDGHVQTLGLAGIKDITIDRMEWINADLSRFACSKPYVLIVAGSAPSRPEKRWPAAHYTRLCARLIEDGLQPVLIGTQEEKEIMDSIARSCPKALNLGGQTTLFDIVALARAAAGAIGNDTGPMHMIAPTGCPTLVLFSGSSNPVRHAPKGEHLKTLQVNDLETLAPEEVSSCFETMRR